MTCPAHPFGLDTGLTCILPDHDGPGHVYHSTSGVPWHGEPEEG